MRSTISTDSGRALVVGVHELERRDLSKGPRRAGPYLEAAWIVAGEFLSATRKLIDSETKTVDAHCRKQ